MENIGGPSGGPAISGDNFSTVAITGGTIRLIGQRIQMGGGTLIIGPKVTVHGNVPYDKGFVFENGEASVKGNPELPVDLTIRGQDKLNVPEGTSLTVPEGVTLTVDGELKVEGSLTVEGELAGAGAIRVETGGSITGDGKIIGTVQHKLTEEMVVIEKDSYTYTGEAIEPEVTIEGYTPGEDYTVTYENNTDAGEATIIITPTEEGKLYEAVTMNFTIEKVKPTFAEDDWKVEGKTYDGNAISITTPILNGVNDETIADGVTLSYKGKEEADDTYTEEAPTNVGEYVVKATFAGNDNYTAAEDVTKEFAIQKATPTITLTVPTDAVYDGKAKAATAEVTGVEGETAELEAVITYYSAESMAEETEVESPTNAGTYYVKATFAGNDNYNEAETTAQFTISKASVTLEYKEAAITKQYGDAAFVNELTNESGVQVSYSSSDEMVATVDENGEVTIHAVGETTITATVNDPNYTGEATYTLEVEAGEVEISRPDEQEQTITLEAGGTAFTLTATITGLPDSEQNGNWEWVSSDTDIATVEEIETLSTRAGEVNTEIKSEALVTPVGEGTATITVTYESTNYKGTLTYDVSVKAKEEEPAPKPDPTPLYYNIQFEDICEGVDASLSKSVVKEGNQVSVYVEVEEGYDAENLKVMCKRSLYGYWEEVEEGVQPGEYIIYNVYTDIYVKVEGVEKIEIEEEPTGMSDIEGTKVYTQNGSLYVYTSQPQEVMIITMNGTILKRERQEGLRFYPLPKGVYIICIGEERMKVRN